MAEVKPPKVDEIWHVQWRQGGAGKVNNILVKVTENKTKFDPPNWRMNMFNCLDPDGKETGVLGSNFIECWGYAKM